MKSKRFNIIDFILVFTLLLIVAVTVYRALNDHRSFGSEEPIKYTLVSQEIDAAVVTLPAVGDTVFAENGREIGTVSAVLLAHPYRTVETPDGAFSRHIDPSRRVMTLTVEASGKVDENGFVIGREQVFPIGATVNAYAGDFAVHGKITAVNTQ